MTTDLCLILGGWLLVSNVVTKGPSPPKVSIETSYRGISGDQMVLTKDAMNELRTHLPFTQLRLHCSKLQGRTFHVTTAANKTGEAAVQYFSVSTCNVFLRCVSTCIVFLMVCIYLYHLSDRVYLPVLSFWWCVSTCNVFLTVCI